MVRKQRLEQNMSQQALCQGICSVSYLSKIEKGNVTCSYEILEQLLDVLGIHLPKEEKSLALDLQKIDLVVEHITFGYQEEAHLLYLELVQNEEMYLHSPLRAPYLIAKASIKEVLEDLAGYYECLCLLREEQDYLTPEQVAHVYFLEGVYALGSKSLESLDFLKKAYALAPRSRTLLYLAYAYYYSGAYGECIQTAHKAYEILMEEGNVEMGKSVSMTLAAAYSNIGSLDKAIGIYQRVLRLIYKDEDSHKVKALIYYNIGASHLIEEAYEKAKPFLDLATTEYAHKDFCETEKTPLYQKQALCCHALGLMNEAKAWAEQAAKSLQKGGEEGLNSKSSLFACVDWLLAYVALEEPQKDALCLQKLEKTYTLAKKDSHFGVVLFYSHYLIKAYKAQRKYKEALSLKEEMDFPTNPL